MNESGLHNVEIVMWLRLYLEQILTKDKDLFENGKSEFEKHVCTYLE
jgi:hypothetical protein